jgi:hypothetical protein
MDKEVDLGINILRSPGTLLFPINGMVINSISSHNGCIHNNFL